MRVHYNDVTSSSRECYENSELYLSIYAFVPLYNAVQINKYEIRVCRFLSFFFKYDTTHIVNHYNVVDDTNCMFIYIYNRRGIMYVRAIVIWMNTRIKQNPTDLSNSTNNLVSVKTTKRFWNPIQNRTVTLRYAFVEQYLWKFFAWCLRKHEV